MPQHYCLSDVLVNILGCSRKNPHPETDGILEILAGGGFKDSGNPGGRRGSAQRSLLQGSFQLIVHAIRMFSLETLKRSQTLKMVEIFCSHISHPT